MATEKIAKLLNKAFSSHFKLSACFIILCFSSCKSVTLKTRSQYILTGHRGSGGLAPENTLLAIDSGIANGVDFLEIDIRQTKDGHIVVMHDKKVNRTTSGKGRVNELTLEQIKELDAKKKWKDKYSERVKVPLLQEVMDRVKNSPARLIIEIKNPKDYPGMVERLIAMLKNENLNQKFLVFSFDRSSVIQVKKEIPGIQTGIFVLGIENISHIERNTFDFISPNWRSLCFSHNLTRRIHEKGSKVLVWTPDRSWMINYALEVGADGIITNRPDVFNNLNYGKN